MAKVPGRVWMSVAVCLIVAVPIGVVLAPGLTGAAAPGTGPGATGASSSVAATLKLGSAEGSHGGSPFFAVVLTDDATPVKSLVALGAYLNSTPFRWIRFGGVGAAYDPTISTNYVPPPSGNGTYVAVHGQLWDLTWFRSWCYSQTPHCSWLGYLPGEENNTPAAVHTAEWYHNVLHFVPTYWEFGNEPNAWTHYGKNVSTWSTADKRAPTGLDYATMVHNYIAAVHAVFPGDRFLGIEAACACNSALVTDTARVDGAYLSAMAYHSYPTQTGSTTTLSKFYGLLASAANLTHTVAQFRGNVASGCRTCRSLPVELGEYQAGPFYAFSPLSATYAGAPFIVGSVIEAIGVNVSQFTVFNSNSLFDLSTDRPTYEGLAFQRILDNLTMGADTSIMVKAPATMGLWALLTTNGTHRSLLLVNTNTATALSLSIPSTVFATGGAGSYWQWTPTSATPTTGSTSSLPSSYTVSAQGILLLTV